LTQEIVAASVARKVMNIPRYLARLCPPALLISLLSGCVAGRIQPNHFQFVTVVEKTRPGPDGWRAACIHAKVKNGTTGEFIICRFGVEVPIENRDGPVSIPLAQRVAADCANEAAIAVLGAATRVPDPPLGILCETFKTTYGQLLSAAVSGARVTRVCNKKAKPVLFGELSS
jgi:hypothetical protein